MSHPHPPLSSHSTVSPLTFLYRNDSSSEPVLIRPEYLHPSLQSSSSLSSVFSALQEILLTLYQPQSQSTASHESSFVTGPGGSGFGYGYGYGYGSDPASQFFPIALRLPQRSTRRNYKSPFVLLGLEPVLVRVVRDPADEKYQFAAVDPSAAAADADADAAAAATASASPSRGSRLDLESLRVCEGTPLGRFLTKVLVARQTARKSEGIKGVLLVEPSEKQIRDRRQQRNEGTDVVRVKFVGEGVDGWEQQLEMGVWRVRVDRMEQRLMYATAKEAQRLRDAARKRQRLRDASTKVDHSDAERVRRDFWDMRLRSEAGRVRMHRYPNESARIDSFVACVAPDQDKNISFFLTFAADSEFAVQIFWNGVNAMARSTRYKHQMNKMELGDQMQDFMVLPSQSSLFGYVYSHELRVPETDPESEGDMFWCKVKPFLSPGELRVRVCPKILLDQARWLHVKDVSPERPDSREPRHHLDPRKSFYHSCPKDIRERDDCVVIFQLDNSFNTLESEGYVPGDHIEVVRCLHLTLRPRLQALDDDNGVWKGLLPVTATFRDLRKIVSDRIGVSLNTLYRSCDNPDPIEDQLAAIDLSLTDDDILYYDGWVKSTAASLHPRDRWTSIWQPTPPPNTPQSPLVRVSQQFYQTRYATNSHKLHEWFSCLHAEFKIEFVNPVLFRKFLASPNVETRDTASIFFHDSVGEKKMLKPFPDIVFPSLRQEMTVEECEARINRFCLPARVEASPSFSPHSGVEMVSVPSSPPFPSHTHVEVFSPVHEVPDLAQEPIAEVDHSQLDEEKQQWLHDILKILPISEGVAREICFRSRTRKDAVAEAFDAVRKGD